MISKSALQNYLSRPLDNHDWIKEVPKSELEKEFDILFKIRPYKHQYAMSLLSTSYKGFCYFADMGTGKTKAVLSTIEWHKKHKNIEHILVIVPNEINIAEWISQIKIHSNLKAIELHGSVKERLQAFNEHADIYIINYPGLQTLMSTFANKPFNPAKDTVQRRQRVFNEEMAYEFCKKFQMVVFDEIHKAKSDNSLVSKLCEFISSNVSYRIGMTGTPFGKEPDVLYNIFWLIDRGETFGQNKKLFLTSYFTAKVDYFGNLKYNLKPGMQDLLYSHCKHRSIRYTREECEIELPERTYIPIYLKLPPDIRAYYKSLLKFKETETRFEDLDKKTQQNVYAKQRELCSGFVYLTEEEDESIRKVLKFSPTQKEEAVLSILESSPDDSKVVIFYFFEETCNILQKLLTKEKISFTVMKGKDASKNYTDFKNGKYKVFLLNVASATGLNLQVANYIIHYEPTDKVIDHMQNSERVYRPGQTKKVFEYQLITLDTVENDKILKSLTLGKNLFKNIIDRNSNE